MQLTAVQGDRLFLVAPLFHELLYVLARSDSDIETMEDLRGKRVALGPHGSGSWETSELVFDSLNLSDSITPVAVIELGRPLLTQMLRTRRCFGSDVEATWSPG